MELSREEASRYSRQIIIPDIGEEGQKKIKKARVFVAGLGGLGSISSYYLAAAGIGNLKIVDKDKVDYSNLNRQIIHWTDNIGEYKTESGRRKLNRLNPNCDITAVRAEITEQNSEELVGDCALIIDATDNMEARRVLNAVSVKKRIPFIYGGVNQLDGLVSMFIPGKTPCLECVFPYGHEESTRTPPGIMGPVPGIIACVQVIEAIKYIVGLEGLLTGRLLCFSGYDMTFREFRISRNPDCPACGNGGVV
ncbi:MAG TPA: HesA/MoeB/ThiF family protein [Acidobacteriota bacterium]|nr:HesA/MoeB/ThiF family protein [Acidobacteriota bacterium]